MKKTAITLIVMTAAFVLGMLFGKNQESKLRLAETAAWVKAAEPFFDGYQIPKTERTAETLHDMMRPGLATNVSIGPDVWELHSLVKTDRPNYREGRQHKPVF